MRSTGTRVAIVCATSALLAATAMAVPAAAVSPHAAGFTVGPTTNGAAPTGALSGIWCASSTACIAVGSQIDAYGYYEPLAESWNGSTWSALLPISTPTGTVSSQLLSVSCASMAACVAVGHYENHADQTLPLAEAYDGVEWTAQSTPEPAGAAAAQLSSVSCLSGSCVAVGWWNQVVGGTSYPYALSGGTSGWSLDSPVTTSGAHPCASQRSDAKSG